MLKVKNTFGVTIQGEGKQAGLPAIFIRFAGCNIWNGQEETREGNPCHYCDTDFRGGDFKTPAEIVEDCNRLRGAPRPMLAVITGGEPLLQPAKDLKELVLLLRQNKFITQLETNGTVGDNEATIEFDFITVSPKKPRALLNINLADVDCIKILYPHPTVSLNDFLELPTLPAYQGTDFCIQPIDLPYVNNTPAAVEMVKLLGYPWRLSLQTHKMLGEE